MRGNNESSTGTMETPMGTRQMARTKQEGSEPTAVVRIHAKLAEVIEFLAQQYGTKSVADFMTEYSEKFFTAMIPDAMEHAKRRAASFAAKSKRESKN